MADDRSIHIAMFPWLAFGHMMPWLELAKLIAQKGHKISFISTPCNIERLPKLPPSLSSSLKFVSIPLPQLEGLPLNAEATNDLPITEVPYLKKALDMLQEPLARFFESSRPDWVLFDFAQYWIGPLAKQMNIKSAFFSAFMPAFAAFLGPVLDPTQQTDSPRLPKDLTSPSKWIPFPTKVAYGYYEMNPSDCTVDDDEFCVNDIMRWNSTVESCDIVVIRSCPEFDLKWLQVLDSIYQKPVIPAGLLPPNAYETEDETNTWRSIKKWLDTQEKGSVVYVAFGSESKPTQSQLTELALGFELSRLPFFWVLKTQRGETDNDVIELPPGFEERTKGRGVVCTSWVPQLKILAHDSVGGFLNHSGWSSVVESLMFGRPLILLSYYADHGINAKVLEEKKIGYPIPRNELDGSFISEAVAESLRLVVVSEEGKIYRDKARELSVLFGDRNLQDNYVVNLLSYLTRNGN